MILKESTNRNYLHIVSHIFVTFSHRKILPERSHRYPTPANRRNLGNYESTGGSISTENVVSSVASAMCGGPAQCLSREPRAILPLCVVEG